MLEKTSPLTTAPVSQNERIVILDALRGIAILGILLMNIPGFALPAPAAYGDLVVMNEMGTINEKTWFIVDWIFEGSQRALFSMLFGAGIILFMTRQEKRAEGLQPADYFYRRQLWLLVFGLVNAYLLLWFWDILFAYACCGMILFTFRKLSPGKLMIAALACLLLMTARENINFYREKAMIREGEAIAALDTSVVKLDVLQKEKLNAMTEFREKSDTASRRKTMEKSLAKVRGDYSGLYEYQSERSFRGQTYFLFLNIWDLFLFMFIGMAFYKNGVLTGKAPMKTYWILALGGLGLGLVISWFRLQPLFDFRFNQFEYTRAVTFEYYEISRALRALGLFGLLMLLLKSGAFGWLIRLMRPVGQMAFTNYLMQSLLVGLFFYGIGLGMFGKLERHQIYYVVAGTWALQILYSHIWLRFFRFGPLEWAWRSLTYWKRQPMKKDNPRPVSGA